MTVFRSQHVTLTSQSANIHLLRHVAIFSNKSDHFRQGRDVEKLWRDVLKIKVRFQTFLKSVSLTVYKHFQLFKQYDTPGLFVYSD